MASDAVRHLPNGTVRAAIDKAAHAAGRAAGQQAGTVLGALRRCGYRPCQDLEGAIELRNCPFHRVAQDHREVVCGPNLRLVRGIVASAGGRGSQAQLDPQPDRCCVTNRATAPAS